MALLGSCKKDVTTSNLTRVVVQIDYLGDGGYYNDNIDGIPYGLYVGTNGPFEVDASKSYSIEYYPNNNWTTPAKIESWRPTTNVAWVIHCYVSDNVAYIQTYPQ